MEVFLRVVAPDEEEPQEIVLDGPRITIGRDPKNILWIDKTFISARHAIIHRVGDQFFLEDCDSRNGTRINGEKVGRQRLEFKVGDILRFGSLKFEVIGKGDLEPEPAGDAEQASQSNQGTEAKKGISVIPLKDRRRSGGPKITSP